MSVVDEFNRGFGGGVVAVIHAGARRDRLADRSRHLRRRTCRHPRDGKVPVLAGTAGISRHSTRSGVARDRLLAFRLDAAREPVLTGTGAVAETPALESWSRSHRDSGGGCAKHHRRAGAFAGDAELGDAPDAAGPEISQRSRWLVASSEACVSLSWPLAPGDHRGRRHDDGSDASGDGRGTP